MGRLDGYAVGAGLLEGANRALGSYFDATRAREDRTAKEKELKASGLIQARAAGLIPQYDEAGNIVDYAVDEQMLKLKQPQLGMPVLTKGQEAADTTFGKDYADYQAGGGKTGVEKNIGLLESGIKDLGAGKKITGGASGILPKFAYDIVNPEGAKVRDQIEGSIQGVLRQVLGPQYTEKEGTRIFERAFNPRLSDEENKRRAEVELDALRAMAMQKDAAARYYEQNGTLQGFKPASNNPGLLQTQTAQPEVREWQGKRYVKQGDMWVEVK